MLDYLHQQWRYFFQEIIIHVIIPSRYEYAVFRLEDKVVADIVNNNRLIDVSAEQTEILDEERSVLRGVLSVQSVLDVVCRIDLVDDLISVVLEGCREDHQLVELGHQLDEIHTAWSHQEVRVRAVLQQLRSKNTSTL